MLVERFLRSCTPARAGGLELALAAPTETSGAPVLAREFLAATSRLAAPSTRVVYRNREKRIAVSKRVYDMMSAEDFVLVLVSAPPSHGARVVVEEAP